MRLEDVTLRGRFVGPVSGEWGAGAVVRVVGPTGSGKSSLLDVITGFLRPSSGGVCLEVDRRRVMLVRRRLWAAPLARRVSAMGVGRGFQSRERLGAMQTADCVAIAKRRRFANGHGAVPFDEAVDALFSAAGIDLDARVAALSYGQSRLLGVVCACIVGAKAVVLDEPAAGIAAEARVQLAHLLDQVSRCGVLLILAEHDDQVISTPTSTLRLTI